MTLQRPHLVTAAIVTLVFGVTFAALTWVNRGTSPAPRASSSGAAPPARPGAPTDQLIRGYQAALRASAGKPDLYAALGGAYLQKVRETGDASFYARAEGVLESGMKLAPRNSPVLTGLGMLALARHDFREGLRLGLAARRANPDSDAAFPVIVDGLVELGRYADAARTLQRFVDEKPTLASYARVSYYRELRGDLAGAVEAMRLAVSAGGSAPENVAYVQTLLGNLEFERGHLAAAAGAYRLALARFPAYAQASAGLARVDAARGHNDRAIRRYREVVARLPLPEYVIALGETELGAGRAADARRDLALVRAEERLLRANGVNTDTELALFEANHGSASRAVALARQAWAHAPSVRSADALGWALTRAGRPRPGLEWARRALRLGSSDRSFLYHAGMSARAAGEAAAARTYLQRSLAGNNRFSPLYAARAAGALAQLP